MKRLPCLLLLIFFNCGGAYAQQKINGLVLKTGDNARIAQALVTNLKSHIIIMTDELGMFNIKAVPGDTLLITKKGYYTVKQAVLNSTDAIVYMQPDEGIQLDEVTIKEQSKKRELTDVMQDYRAQGSFFNGKPPALIFLTSPITGLYELFGKTPRRAAHFARFARAELEQDEINRRYNREFVKRVTGIATDDEAQKFMDIYSPSFEDLKSWNDYDLVKNVKRWYQYYKKNDTPVQPLKP